MKSDVKEALVNFVKCRWRTANAIYVEERRLRQLGLRNSEIKRRMTMLGLKNSDIKRRMSMMTYPHDLPRQRADFTFAGEEIQNNNDEPDDNMVVDTMASTEIDGL